MESDDLNLEGNLYGTLGNNFNYEVPFTKEGILGVDLNYRNLSTNIDPDKNIRNIGYNTNIGGYDIGANYGDGNTMFTIGTKFNKGGLAGILNLS